MRSFGGIFSCKHDCCGLSPAQGQGPVFMNLSQVEIAFLLVSWRLLQIKIFFSFSSRIEPSWSLAQETFSPCFPVPACEGPGLYNLMCRVIGMPWLLSWKTKVWRKLWYFSALLTLLHNDKYESEGQLCTWTKIHDKFNTGSQFTCKLWHLTLFLLLSPYLFLFC